MVLERIFTRSIEKIHSLLVEASPDQHEVFLKRFTAGIDQIHNPKTMMFALNVDGQYVGWLHVSVTPDWADLDPFIRLYLNVSFNQVYIGKEFRGLGYAKALADLSGTLAASLVDLDALYLISPASKPGPTDEIADPYRELSTTYSATIIHPGGYKTLEEFRSSFDNHLDARCSPKGYFLWQSVESEGLDDIDFDILSAGFSSVPDDDFEMMRLRLH